MSLWARPEIPSRVRLYFVALRLTTEFKAGRRVTRLEYEAYLPLAEKTIVGILNEARSCQGLESVRPQGVRESETTAQAPGASNTALIRCAVQHRLGEVPVGEISILVGVASPHRKEAFIACEYILEEVKLKAQIWKREWYHGGEEEDARWKSNHEPMNAEHDTPHTIKPLQLHR